MRSPIGNFGDQVGTSVGRPSGVQPADTITFDLKRLIASQLNGDARLPIEDQIAAFDKWPAPDTDKMAARNSIVSSVVWASNANCLVYLQYLRGNQVLTRSVSGVLTSVFSAASTAFSPKSTKSALSALSSIASGAGAAIDAAAFAQQTLDVIAGAIEADRADFQTNTLTKDFGRHYADLSLAAALADAEIYHNKCDVMAGLHYLQLQTASSNTRAKPNVSTQDDQATQGQGTGAPSAAAATTGSKFAQTAGRFAVNRKARAHASRVRTAALAR